MKIVFRQAEKTFETFPENQRLNASEFIYVHRPGLYTHISKIIYVYNFGDIRI